VVDKHTNTLTNTHNIYSIFRDKLSLLWSSETHWKNVPDEDKIVLLSHMNNTGLLWFEEETMKKHKIDISPEYHHLLGDATGPMPKLVKST
jgi:hypothetical protein